MTLPSDGVSRRIPAEIDIDMSEQQKLNGEWVPLLASDEPNAADDLTRKTDDPPAIPQAELDAFDRNNRARAHAGGLRQGVTATTKSGLWRGGRRDCFEAVGTYLIDRSGVTLLFPTGLGGELNRFFIERVDVDAEHSTLYLSRGSCRLDSPSAPRSLAKDPGSHCPLPLQSDRGPGGDTEGNCSRSIGKRF